MMYRSRVTILCAAWLTGLRALAGTDYSAEQQIDLEFRQFAQPSAFVDHNQDGSLSWQGRFSWRLERSHNHFDEFSLVPYARVNSLDSQRSRFDLQSLSWTRVQGDWEWRAGIRTISWRTTEALHLVDIINQTDLTGDVDGEDKLGQPMLNVLWSKPGYSVELFLLPGFRERIFPGEDARLRSAIPFDSDTSRYESGAEHRRVDAAVRATAFAGDLELSISHFWGTSREPLFELRDDRLRPYYPVIEQTGLELTWAAGDWLWKLEAIHRSGFLHRRDRDIADSGSLPVSAGASAHFEAIAGGFEFTWSGLGETGYDVGVLAEYLWDSRREELFANDLFVGLRLGLNDIAGTELLLGDIVDLDHEEHLGFIEFSRRLGNNARIDLTMRLFDGSGDTLQRMRNSDFFTLHDDDYLSLSYSYFF